MALWTWGTAQAVQFLGLGIDRLIGPGYHVEGFQWAVDLATRKGLSVQGRAQRLTVGGLSAPIQGLSFRCDRLTLEGMQAGCADLRLRLRHPWLDRAGSRWAFSWDGLRKVLAVTLKRLYLGGGIWSGKGRWASVGWVADLRAHGLAGKALSTLLRPWLQGVQLQGRLDLEARGRGQGAAWAWLKLKARTVDLGFSSADAAWLGQGIAGVVGVESRPGPDAHFHLGLQKGEVLSPYFYLSPGEGTVSLDGRVRREGSDLRFEDLRLEDSGRLACTGRLRLDAAFRPVSFDLRVPRTPAQALYAGYFQPLLGETPWQSLTWEGGLALQARRAGATEARLQLFELGLEDLPVNPGTAPRFGLHGLNGQVQWSDRGPRRSYLRWRAGHLSKALTLGAAEVRFELDSQGGGRLLAPLKLPVVDGALLLDRLRWDPEGRGAVGFDLDAVVTPISLERLSAALDWPPLAGTLSGVIPGVRYRQGELRVRGKLLIRVFGGELVVEHLRLAHLLGPLPVLEADIGIHGLDLELLTRTFAFGRITGHLDGEIRGLRLEGWRPVAFDARLATPGDDPVPHRIDQRAVDNLTALSGGGVANGLSRTFLKMFDEFHYGRLGLSCRLEQGVCHLGGVEEATRGYYLVTPAGLPRIDVRGYNRRADWGRLLEQLSQITVAGTPEVKVGE